MAHFETSHVARAGSNRKYDADIHILPPPRDPVIQNKFLLTEILDSIITDVAAFYRQPDSSETKRRLREARQWVESPVDQPVSFLYIMGVISPVAEDEDSHCRLVIAFRQIVRLELLPACVDPHTFRRID